VPADTLTDGSLSGTMQFDGASISFPLSATIDATARTFQGSVRFRDVRQEFDGTVDGRIDAGGAITGTLSATGKGDGTKVTGTVRGHTDNTRACGTWNNQYGQTGTWEVHR
jgi:hypothetical protein